MIMRSKFEIGCCVKVGSNTGKIIDRFFSEKNGSTHYYIEFDNGDREFCMEDVVLPIQEFNADDCAFSVDIAGNVVVLVLRDGSGKEIARGHGHLIHEGILGLAQAMSYAAKRLFYNAGGALITKKNGGNDNG